MSGQGWTTKAVTPGFCVPQGTSRRVAEDSDWGLALTIQTAQSTLSTCGGGEVLPPGTTLLPLQPLVQTWVSWGHEAGFSSKSTEWLKGTHDICEQAVCPRSACHLLFPSRFFIIILCLDTREGKRGLNYVNRLTSNNLASVS